MIIPDQPKLFAWGELEDSPSLETLRELLGRIPDGQLLASLRQARGRGRNDFPVEVLWGVVVLTIALRHASIEACLGELRRNPDLRKLLGIDSESDVPKKWNISRFLKVLGQAPHRILLQQMHGRMIAVLAEAVKTLGQETAGDATILSARRTGAKGSSQAASAEDLPQPKGGRKEYVDDEGNVTKVVEWFGYKLHLLVDSRHEVALAYHITDPTAGDGETLDEILTQAETNLPEGRIQTLAYDKAADGVDVHKRLAKSKIKPVIQMRHLWDSDPERPLPNRSSNQPPVLYDEAGSIYCYDCVSYPKVRHRMSYIGYEKSRGTLKYRCPACHENWDCPGLRQCNTGKRYGLTVRVKQDLDLRRFPPIPRATKKFERLYRGRSAVERVNGRFKVFWGVDDGNITGAERFHAYAGTVMIVHAAFATILAGAPRRKGTLGKISLGPVQEALKQAKAQ